LNLVAQKSAKKKAKKPAKRASGKSVLGNLPSTRPERIGGERRAKARPVAAAKPAKPKKAAQAKVKPTKRVVPGPKPAPPPPRRDDSPGVVTTAVQAAGELAQIGATVGGQLLKRAARRIPRP
jgi:hypothetical protein